MRLRHLLAWHLDLALRLELRSAALLLVPALMHFALLHVTLLHVTLLGFPLLHVALLGLSLLNFPLLRLALLRLFPALLHLALLLLLLHITLLLLLLRAPGHVVAATLRLVEAGSHLWRLRLRGYRLRHGRHRHLRLRFGTTMVAAHRQLAVAAPAHARLAFVVALARQYRLGRT